MEPGERPQNSFGPRELGVLDGPPEKGFDVVVRLAAIALKAPMVALMMFDDEKGSIVLRAFSGKGKDINLLLCLPLAGSIASLIRSENRSVAIDDVSQSDLEHEVETKYFGAKACLGTPVDGPAGEPIGVLAALHHKSHAWTPSQADILEGFSYLTSQQIMLKASFETLRLMKRQSRTSIV